jgi:hypothetical protein
MRSFIVRRTRRSRLTAKSGGGLAVEGKLLTERRLGDALAAMAKQHGSRGVGKKVELHDVTPLADLGISKVQSHRWQKERVSVTPVCATN